MKRAATVALDYARALSAGKLPAGKWTRLAFERPSATSWPRPLPLASWQRESAGRGSLAPALRTPSNKSLSCVGRLLWRGRLSRGAEKRPMLHWSLRSPRESLVVGRRVRTWWRGP